MKLTQPVRDIIKELMNNSRTVVDKIWKNRQNNAKPSSTNEMKKALDSLSDEELREIINSLPEMTAEQKEQQRQSFVWGNMAID